MKIVGLIFTLLIVLSVSVLACKSAEVKDTLLEGESRLYNLEGMEYIVESTFIDSDEAKFVVNGESTNKLKIDETYVLNNKSEIGVSEILYQSFAGGVHSVSFQIKEVCEETAPVNQPPYFIVIPAIPEYIAVEETHTFSVIAEDPEGDPISIRWTMGGFIVSRDSFFSYTPSVDDLGLHRIDVQIDDGRLSDSFEFVVEVRQASQLVTNADSEEDKKEEPAKDVQKKRWGSSRRNSLVEEPLPTQPAVEVIYLDDINMNYENTENVEKNNFLERLFSKIKSWFG